MPKVSSLSCVTLHLAKGVFNVLSPTYITPKVSSMTCVPYIMPIVFSMFCVPLHHVNSVFNVLCSLHHAKGVFNVLSPPASCQSCLQCPVSTSMVLCPCHFIQKQHHHCSFQNIVMFPSASRPRCSPRASFPQYSSPTECQHFPPSCATVFLEPFCRVLKLKKWLSSWVNARVVHNSHPHVVTGKIYAPWICLFMLCHRILMLSLWMTIATHYTRIK